MSIPKDFVNGPLVSGIAVASGAIMSMQIVNEWLQFLVLLCSAVLGISGIYKLMCKKK